jgi:hypothetical protein
MPRALILLALAAALSLVAATAVADASVDAQAARTCSPPKYPGSGYFTGLSVKRVSCRTGRRFALAYYRCRTARSRAGRCRRDVLGYSCSERRQSIPTEIQAQVTCRRGSRRIVHSYQQNT